MLSFTVILKRAQPFVFSEVESIKVCTCFSDNSIYAAIETGGGGGGGGGRRIIFI